MSDEATNRTMIGLSPFRPDDDPADVPPEPASGRSTGEVPVVAPVSLSDDDGWDLPDLPAAAPAAIAALPLAAPATPAVTQDAEAASLRGGTMMLSAGAFQDALALADAAAGARRSEPTRPEGEVAQPPGGPARPGTVRLNAVDFERLMTTGSRPSPSDGAAVAELAKHALGADELTDARLAMPGRPMPQPASHAGPASAAPARVADRVADRRAAASARAPSSVARSGRGVAWAIAAGLCVVLAAAGALVWFFVLRQ